MSVYIQELIRGHIEKVNEENIEYICKELRQRKIPYKIDYVYNEQEIDTMTQPLKNVVSTAKTRASKIL